MLLVGERVACIEAHAMEITENSRHTNGEERTYLLSIPKGTRASIKKADEGFFVVFEKSIRTSEDHTGRYKRISKLSIDHDQKFRRFWVPIAN